MSPAAWGAAAPDAVEEQLRTLWCEAARAAAGAGTPLIRAAVYGLVVVTDGARAIPEVSQLLVDVSAMSPGRMIVLAPEPGAACAGVDAWVSLHCRASGRGAGARQVCGEQVVIEARGETAGRLPSIVRPLLPADLPVVLWWRAPLPAEPSLLDRLAALARLVVVDTARGAEAADPIEAVKRLLARRAPGPSGEAGSAAPAAPRAPWGAAVEARSPWAEGAPVPERAGAPWVLRDLAFARLGSWRELTAALFDLAGCRAMLDRIATVSVAGRPDAPETRLYIGWLASQLGWRAAGGGSPAARDYVRPDGGSLAVRVAPAGVEVPLAAVAFEGPGASARLRMRAAAPGGAWTLEVGARIDGRPPISRTVAVEAPDEARLLAAELALGNDDRTYEAAVRAVAP